MLAEQRTGNSDNSTVPDYIGSIITQEREFCSVNHNMKPLIGCVVLNTKTDMEVYELLACSGQEIRLLKTIEDIHNSLIAGICDIVVVNRRVFDTRRFSPKRHLWSFTSPSIIITYLRDKHGSLELQLYSVPDDVHLYKLRKDPELVYKTLQDALARGAQRRADLVDSHFVPGDEFGTIVEHGFTDAPESIYGSIKKRSSTKSVSLNETQRKMMNQKLWKLLELLDEHRHFGASPMQIEHFLWQNKYSERDRKKDIQSYISKLRTILNTDANNTWQIVFNDKSYYLIHNKEAETLTASKASKGPTKD